MAGAGPVVDAEQADVTGPVPVAPNQRWFGAMAITDPHHWNRSVQLEIPQATPPTLVERAVEHLMVHHDGLRQRILLAGADRMRVRIAQRGDVTPFAAYDLTGLEEAEQRRRIEEVAVETQASLDPAVGPLARFALFRLGGDRPDRLAIVAHRLVADAASMRILVEDLNRALGQLVAGEPVTLPPKTTSWQSWVRRLIAYAATPTVQSQRGYWSELVAAPSGRLPVDRPTEPAADTAATERTVVVALDRGETADLLATPEAFACGIDEVLLAALGRVLCGWSGADRHLVDVERPGRDSLFDEVDLSRTVGWFSRTHPVALTGAPHDTPRSTLKAVKEALRTVPADGGGWQLLRADPEPVTAAPVELAFAFLGDVDAPGFTPVPESIGPDAGPRGQRPYPILVEASLHGGTLVVHWRYSESRHERSTVLGLGERYLAELRAFIEAAAHPVETMLTPADFPLARLDQARLDDLLNRI